MQEKARYRNNNFQPDPPVVTPRLRRGYSKGSPALAGDHLPRRVPQPYHLPPLARLVTCRGASSGGQTVTPSARRPRQTRPVAQKPPRPPQRHRHDRATSDIGRDLNAPR